jgi:hypothetical protein
MTDNLHPTKREQAMQTFAEILQFDRIGRKRIRYVSYCEQGEVDETERLEKLADWHLAEVEKGTTWEMIARRPIVTMTVVDLDADSTGNTRYEEEGYFMPKKYVDAQLRQHIEERKAE